MKKYLVVLAALFLIASVAYAGQVYTAGTVSTRTNADNNATREFALDGVCSKVSVVIPTLSVASIVNAQVSDDNTTWYYVNGLDNGIRAATASTAGNYVWVVPADLSGWKWFRIYCTTAQSDNTAFKVKALK